MKLSDRIPVAVRVSIAHRRCAAFTLVELLTVVFIISLLIGILIPSLSAARTAAKKTATKQTIRSVDAGLEMFRQEHGSDFARTNGYPPSFVYPSEFGRGGSFTRQDALEGRFPFFRSKPVTYGAMWLPAMLMGVDQLGYIDPDSVPRQNELHEKPEEWYKPDPQGDETINIPRSPFYLDPDTTRTLKLRDLPGREPEWWRDSPDWGVPEDPEAVQNMKVMVDAFEYPLLYYVSHRNGRPTNMTSDEIDENNEYDGGVQETGPPYYFHSDNHGFTGHSEDGTIEEEGWDFNGVHPLAEGGGTLDAKEIADDEREMSFARYIIDRKILRDLRGQASPDPNTPLRPVNADTYLLISPGPDGQWGTMDDVSNLPDFLE